MVDTGLKGLQALADEIGVEMITISEEEDQGPIWPRNGQKVEGFLHVEHIGLHWADKPELTFHDIEGSNYAYLVHATLDGVTLDWLVDRDLPIASGFYYVEMTFWFSAGDRGFFREVDDDYGWTMHTLQFEGYSPEGVVL